MVKKKFFRKEVSGLGNNHFKSSTNQTPRHAQPGEEGSEGWKILELKILADVGLVAFLMQERVPCFPVVSAAKPEIADYPFTTPRPNLGIVSYRDYRSFVMSDIPGIIKGASEGKGLGYRFLRHIERNSVLLFMIPADCDHIASEYEILKNELEAYNPELMHKDSVLVISKSDMLDDELKQELDLELKEEELEGVPYLYISSVAQTGLLELKDEIWKLIEHD